MNCACYKYSRYVGRHTSFSYTHLNVDEQALDWSERIVDGEVEVEFSHQEQLVVQDYVHGTLLVTLDVGDELIDGHVELLHFAGKVCGRHSRVFLRQLQIANFEIKF